MNVIKIQRLSLENAIREVCLALENTHQEQLSWSKMPEDALWRELVACILGSRVRFEIAYSAVERMDKRQLFREHRRSSHFAQFERDITNALFENGSVKKTERYPFFRVRANQIRRAAEWLYQNNGTLGSFLQNSHGVRAARRQLAAEVSGLGPKQASLFLRNIGYADHVAVLDIHVLTYMSWVGLTETPVKSIPTVRKYEALEDIFIEHAYSYGYTPNRFDLAVWVVVKVVKEVQGTWE
ncbi:hypothetical protein KQI52_12840 [bacterium]|nr:hypothetical protein [bacterium]